MMRWVVVWAATGALLLSAVGVGVAFAVGRSLPPMQIAYLSYNAFYRLNTVNLVDARSGHLHRYDKPLEGTTVSIARWSPDGTQLAHLPRNAMGVADTALHIYDLDTMEVRPLVRLSNMGSNFVWSPDGERIAIELRDSGGLMVVDAATGERQRIAEGTSAVFTTWAADGARLAFSTSHGDRPSVFVVDMDDNVENLTGSSTQDMAPEWSPDGKQVVFYSAGENRTPGIYAVDDNGENPRLVLETERFMPGGGPSELAWSPDSTTLAFTQVDDNQQRHVHALDMASGAVTQLTFNNSIDLTPVWSPDSQWVAFSSHFNTPYGRRAQICIVRVTGEGWRCLEQTDANVAYEAVWWQP